MKIYPFRSSMLAVVTLTSLLCATPGQALQNISVDNFLIVRDESPPLVPFTPIYLENNFTASPPQSWALVNNILGTGEFSINNLSNLVTPFVISSLAPSASLNIDSAGRVELSGAIISHASLSHALAVGTNPGEADISSIGLQTGSDEFQLVALENAGIGLFERGNSSTPLFANTKAGSYGRVGIGGQLFPATTLHVYGEGDASILVQDAQAADTGSARIMFDLNNASQDRIRFAITAPGGKRWTFDNTPASDTFGISKFGTGKTEFLVNNAGDGKFLRNSIAVNHINTSSRASKADFSSVDSRDILARLTALPVSRWRYKAEGPRQRHIGPVAEDFKQVFNLGDGKTISTVDASGIAFAAIKGLKEEKDVEIATLTAKNDRELSKMKADRDRELADRDEEIAALKGQMLQLEMMVAELLRKQSSDLDVSAVTQ